MKIISQLVPIAPLIELIRLYTLYTLYTIKIQMRTRLPVLALITRVADRFYISNNLEII